MKFQSKSVLSVAIVCLIFALHGDTYAKEKQVVQTKLLDAVDKTRNRNVPLKVYWTPSESPQPVVLFSHGLGGSREGVSHLGNTWAKAGYIAVFMQHIGSDQSVWEDVPKAKRMQAMKSAANIRNTLNRFRDVPFVITQLETWSKQKDHVLYGKMNLEKIAMTGHSYGAVTTQAMMGQRFPNGQTVGDDRLDAFIVMSPSFRTMKRMPNAFSKIEKPVFCMTGTKDEVSITKDVTAESRAKVYHALPEGDKFQVVFHDGVHSIFSDRRDGNRNKIDERYHPAIQKLTTKFLDAYLKDDADAKAWLQSKAARDVLIEKDVWEWK